MVQLTPTNRIQLLDYVFTGSFTNIMKVHKFRFENLAIYSPSLPPTRVALQSRTYKKQKKFHKFRRLPLCSILYFNLMEFSENRDKEFQLGLMPFLKLGTLSPAAHFLNCVHIGRSQTIAAIICGLSSGKRFVKLREVFQVC